MTNALPEHTEHYIPPEKSTPPESDKTANKKPTESEVVEMCCKDVTKKGERKMNFENLGIPYLL